MHKSNQIKIKIKWEFKWHLHKVAISPLKSGSNWNLEMLVFEERGKPEYPEKNLSSRDENQQQTQPTYGIESANRSRATLVGGECSHHYTIPAPQVGIGKEFRSQANALTEPWTHRNLSRILLSPICAKIEKEVGHSTTNQNV